MVENGAETPLCFLELILTMCTRGIAWFAQVLMQADPFLSELTNMYERSTEKGSVWVTMKRSSMKCQARLKKMASKGEPVEYRCLVRASDGKRNISTSLSAKEYLKFQASYALVLKAHMHALKKRERKDRKKTVEAEKIPEKEPKKQKKSSSKKSAGSK
ncbi:signal recognition particle 14 kDa protein isoform X1 [Triticum dicoccoides]|uniref:signal recognition particle 14 kDa protein isoform X1 n=1 Tax=Triticum dicoccoides TaxID=85692 RepID=UPI0018900019|nr:signal recognition particle 14 kDa protein isoform X1 [Triticum dicoccoides]